MKIRSFPIPFYLTAPIVVFGIFAYFFLGFQEERRAMLAQQDQAQRQAAAAELESQRQMEEQLANEAEAVKRAKAEGLREREAKILAEKQEKLDAAKRRLKEARSDAGRILASLEEMNAKLDKERAARSSAEDQLIQTSLQVERLNAERASNDLETQRLTERVAQIVLSEMDYALAATAELAAVNPRR